MTVSDINIYVECGKIENENKNISIVPDDLNKYHDAHKLNETQYNEINEGDPATMWTSVKWIMTISMPMELITVNLHHLGRLQDTLVETVAHLKFGI